MTAVEVAEYLGWTRNRANGCIVHTRKSHPGKFFKVVEYRCQVVRQGRDVQVYAAGRGQDVERPPFDRAHTLQRGRDYYKRNRARYAAARQRRAGVQSTTWLSGLLPMARRAAKTIATSAYSQSARG